MSNVKQYTDIISSLELKNMYEGDFFLTWEKSFDEIIPQGRVSPLPRHATCLALRCRTLTRARAR